MYVYLRAFLLTCDSSVLSAAVERSESDREDLPQPERLTESVVPPEDANEISGGRTNSHKHCFQDRRPYTVHIFTKSTTKINCAEYESA